MLAWFFGLGRMTKIAVYLGAIFGAVVTGFKAWDAVISHIH